MGILNEKEFEVWLTAEKQSIDQEHVYLTHNDFFYIKSDTFLNALKEAGNYLELKLYPLEIYKNIKLEINERQ